MNLNPLYIWFALAISIISLIVVIFYRKEESEKVKDFASSALSLVLSSVYIVFWSVFQFIIAKLLEGIKLTGLDYYLLLIGQILFAISTLSFVLIYVYREIKMYWKKVKKEIDS